MIEHQLFPPEEYEQILRDAGSDLKLSKARDVITDAREFGGWTVEKLDVLKLYLRMYRRVAGGGSYVDGFAGNGLVRFKGSEQLHEGSASIALHSGAFKTLFLYERPRMARKLATYMTENFAERDVKRCRFGAGDFNDLVMDDLGANAISRDKPCFAFLDPNSTELRWETIEALANYKEYCPDPEHPKRPVQCKIELWVLLNTHQALARLRERQRRPDYEDSPQAKTMDRVMGGRSAWQAYLDEDRGPSHLAWLFQERLRGLGYRAARSHIILDPDNHRPQYYMVHASDHPAAFSFMRWAERQAVPGRSINEPLPGMRVG